MQKNQSGSDARFDAMTNIGQSIATISARQPVLLVFLRHLGCIFCKEALYDIRNQRADIETRGVQIIFVHMATHEVANKYFKEFELTNIPHISDPDKRLYRSFGVLRGSFSQLYGLTTWIRGYSTVKKGIKSEYNPSVLGDATQMPGLFLIIDSQIKERYIYSSAASRPDYLKMTDACIS